MINVFDDSAGLNLAINLVVLSLVVVHLALVFWTYSDARRRVEDSMLVGCAAVAAFLFPLVGALVYAIVRPPEFIEDVRERELEMQASEARLQQMSYLACPHCNYEVKDDWLRCASCTRKLREPCSSCSKPLDPEWRMCPYCETAVDGGSVARRRRRRSTAPPETSLLDEEPAETPVLSDDAPLSTRSRSKRTSAD